MSITKEAIEKIKSDNAGTELFQGNIAFTDDKGHARTVDFIYRRPSVADLEAYNKQSSKAPLASQQNLLLGLVVYPSSADVSKQLAEYPAAIADFVENQIVPFFGAAVTSTSCRI